MQKLKRGLVSLLVLVMVLSLLPVTALANADTAPSAEPEAVTETAAVPAEDSQEAEEDAAQSEIAKSDLPSVQSMLPLEEVKKTLDLTGYLPGELAKFPVAKLVELLGLGSENPPAVWARYSYRNAEGKYISSNDDFVAFDADGTIDLSCNDAYASSDEYQLELICGTADQLNPENVRYRVTVKFTMTAAIFDYSAYSEARKAIEIYQVNGDSTWNANSQNVLKLIVNKDDWKSGEKAYLGMKLASQFVGLDVTVYEGYYATVDSIPADANDITSQIFNQADLSVSGGYLADCSYQKNYEGMPTITIVVKRGSEVASIVPVVLYMDADGLNLNDGNNLYVDAEYHRDNVLTNNYQKRSTSKVVDGIPTITYMLKPGYKANEQYYTHLYMRNPADETTTDCGIAYVKRAVVGNYQTLEDIPASAPDIKAQLFSYSWRENGGHGADYSNGVTFTVVDINDDIHRITIKVVSFDGKVDTELSSDTYFQMEGAIAVNSEESEAYAAYEMPDDADSYYQNGYQTVFLLKSTYDSTSYKNVYTPVTDDKIKPVFYTYDGVTAYASLDDSGATKQTSGESEIAFTSGNAISYSAAAENGANLANYWVTFLTQQSGTKLFVNATNDKSHYVEVDGKEMPQREVFFTGDASEHHDVFFANIGDQAINGLYVKLENAENIKLDDYWTIGTTKTLGAFTTTDKRTYKGDLNNFAKVRLLPATDEEGNFLSGAISGTLVIGYTGDGTEPVEEVRINLTGTAGTPKIVTDGSKLHDGVKYVPYSLLIQTNNMHGNNKMAFSIVSGNLPDGLTLKPNGEIYGVPTKPGTYTFTVKAIYNGDQNSASTMEGQITIQDNTDANVLATNDDPIYGYKLLDAAPDRINVRAQDFTGVSLRSEGALSEFMKVFLDGKELDPSTYDTEEGSTILTVASEVFRNLPNGSHTLAIEFREGADENGDMRSTAQNIDITGGKGGNGGNGGNNDSNTPSSGGQTTLNNGDGTITTTVVEIISAANLSSADKAILDALLNGKGTAGVYMNISAVVKDSATGKILRYLTETPSPLKVTVDVPQAMLDAQKDGKFIYAVRIHNGKAEFLDTTIRGGKATFSSDKFSTYALVTMDQRVAGVKTGDAGVTAYMVVAFVAVAAGAGVVAVRKRKENYTK